MTTNTPQELLTTKEAAAELKVSKNYLEQLRVTGGGPIFYKLSPQNVRYRRGDLDAWVASCVRSSTSDAGKAA